MRRFDLPGAAIVAVIIVAATAPLWLWAADRVFGFGYTP